MKNTKQSMVTLSMAATLLFLVSGCVTEPMVRTNYDKSANFAAYKTYGYVKELGTDRAGYKSLITKTFKDAVGAELESRGYTYSESDPNLLVNFYTNVHYETVVQSIPAPTAGVGYYGYRYGLYTAPAFDDAYISYPVGTANVDVVDAKSKQLIWSGLVKGDLTDEVMQHPDKAIHNAVSMMFSKFPLPVKKAATQ